MATEPSLPCKAQASKRCLKHKNSQGEPHWRKLFSHELWLTYTHTHTLACTLALAELSVADHTLQLRTKSLRAAWARLIFLSNIKKRQLANSFAGEQQDVAR